MRWLQIEDRNGEMGFVECKREVSIGTSNRSIKSRLQQAELERLELFKNKTIMHMAT